MTETKIPDQKPQSSWDDSFEDEISLIDLAITLAKHKKLILGAPLITVVIVALISLLIPNSYTAKTQILPPQQQSGASALLGQLGALSSLAGVSAGIKNPNDTYVAMLKSRTVSDNLIRRFKLQAVYDKKYSSDTRKKLEKASTITAGKDGVIVVMVDDRDPKRAAALANGYVEELQQLTQVLAVTEASQRRLFFEKQLLQAKQALGDAEIALKKLQETTGLIQLDAQAEALVKAGSELKAQIAMKEVELGAMRTFATGNNPDYIRIEQLLGGLRSQLAKVEAGSVTISKVPEAGLEYVRKVRDLKYAETVYELLAKQFEIAKIDEAKEGSVIQVLDKAVVPEKKSKPKRSLMVILAALAVGFGAVLWAVIVEGLIRAKEDAENAARLAKLRQLLKWK
ncbi:MAG: lipopolysaccharide biosynthesis protein [Chlorobium sp.]|nr:MAG: lipopolysaccharide biosynthesis protein [Chlorobium sp.]